MLWIAAALASGAADGDENGHCPAVEVEVDGLKGVKVRFPEQPCAFAVGAKPSPLKVVVVIEDSPGELKHQDGNCGSLDVSGFLIDHRVVQGDHAYHPWDFGECEPMDDARSTPKPGAYPATFDWSPHDWDGPSCTDEPYGAPFVAGKATYEVSFSGTRKGRPFSVRAAYPITLR